MRYLIALGLALWPMLAVAGTETCFHKGDVVDGLNKVCYYDCPSGTAAITVKSYQICPINIQR